MITTNMETYCHDTTKKGSQSVLVYIPSTKEVMEIRCDGDGSQLLCEDRQEGYVDYVYAEAFEYVGSAETDCGFECGDGDLYMTKEAIADIQSILYEFMCYRYDGECPYFVVLENELE